QRPDGQVVVRLCDFGLAKRVELYDDTQLTRTGASIGSPMYMSPEQIQSGKHLDERSDVWSAASTLYEAACGTPPHGDAPTLSELVLRICTRNARPLQERAPW